MKIEIRRRRLDQVLYMAATAAMLAAHIGYRQPGAGGLALLAGAVLTLLLVLLGTVFGIPGVKLS